VTSTKRAYLAWVAVCLIWGTTYLAIRIALETIPPFLMAAFRWIVAGTIMAAFLVARGEPLPGRRAWPRLALLGVLLLGFGNGAVVWAELAVPSGLTAVLVATIPFWMVGIETVRPGGDPLSLKQALGLIIGFAGIVLLIGPQIQIDRAGTFMSGVAATQLACIGWAIGSIYSRQGGAPENVFAVTALEMLFGGLAMLLLGSLLHEWLHVAFNARTAGALLYLIVIGSIGGFTAYQYALKHLPIATVSLYAYVNPVIAVVLGTLLLHEPFSVRMLVAAVVIFAGIALVKA
jgi:drug/metabolite transporter (DMT)-like permease